RQEGARTRAEPAVAELIASAPHPNPLPACGERESRWCRSKSLAPLAGRGCPRRSRGRVRGIFYESTTMPIRTGRQFLEALKDDRQIFMDGERVRNIAHDPRTAGAAQTLAELYDMQHEPALRERMTFASPSNGAPVGLSFIEPRTVEDLIRRRGMIKVWMDSTCGMFGRSPDFLNVMLTGLAAAAAEFGKSDKRFADNIRAYHVHARQHHLCMTHTLLNPQSDRSPPVERQ